MKDYLVRSGVSYECFMCKALKTSQKSVRKGTCGSVFTTLVNIENGSALRRKSPDKQLQIVKSNLNKGFEELLMQELSNEKRAVLLYLKSRNNSASDSYELNEIIIKALNVVI